MNDIPAIHENYAKSERVGRLSREARLLHIQLSLIVNRDDGGPNGGEAHGVSPAHPRYLVSRLYPYDEDCLTGVANIECWLTELEQAKFLRKYKVNNVSFLRLLVWPSEDIDWQFSSARAEGADRTQALDRLAELGQEFDADTTHSTRTADSVDLDGKP
jgi:hypothetical protein